MSTRTRSESETHPEVGRAVLAVRRGIGRLAELLADDDLAAVRGAALALEALGGKAVVGALAPALPGAATPRLRAAIAGALFAFHREERAAVVGALIEAIEWETDPVLAINLRAALSAVIAADMETSRPRSHEVRTPVSGGEQAPPQRGDCSR
jgi:hypothetical protein